MGLKTEPPYLAPLTEFSNIIYIIYNYHIVADVGKIKNGRKKIACGIC